MRSYSDEGKEKAEELIHWNNVETKKVSVRPIVDSMAVYWSRIPPI
jgi:hypothetical protein